MASAGVGNARGPGGEDDETPPPHLREISVTDPVKHGEGVNAYMSYRVVSKGGDGGVERISIRRFSDFEWLHTRLCSVHRGIIVPPLPDKNVVEKFRFSRDFIESRRRGLEKFINRVAEHPTLGQAEELRHFLEDDEDSWSKQTMVAADVRGGVLGKKSNEYMNLFKEMQWSLSSVVLGRPAPTFTSHPVSPQPRGATPVVSENGVAGAFTSCSEEENERLKAYTEELEKVFSDAHKQASMFLKKQKEMANSLASLGSSLVALGQVEGTMGHTGSSSSNESEGGGDEKAAQLMNRAFVDVGRRCEGVSTLVMQQSASYSEQVDEAVKEYGRMVLSFRRVLSEQSAALREEKHLEAELHMKKARLAKLNATFVAGGSDRVREAEADVTDAQNKLTSAITQRETLTQEMQGDIQRFHQVMLADITRLLGDLKALHSKLSLRSYECWSEGLPLLREARTALRMKEPRESERGEGGNSEIEGVQGASAST